MAARLINVTHVKRRILDTVRAERPSLRLTRVSARALDLIEIKVNAYILGLVREHPSKGVTFDP